MSNAALRHALSLRSMPMQQNWAMLDLMIALMNLGIVDERYEEELKMIRLVYCEKEKQP